MCKGQIFVASYSGGKDSILAIHQAVSMGMVPLSLLTTYDTQKNQSWFHAVPKDVLQCVSRCVGIPIHFIETCGQQYEDSFEKALIQQKKNGATACVFGDIDIAEHIEWCSKRCENTGMQAVFPLAGKSREQLVYQFIDSGFKAYFTVIDTERIDPSYIGQLLTRQVADTIAATGADMCGENGEYHTFVADGPLFKQKATFGFGNRATNGKYISLQVEITDSLW